MQRIIHRSQMAIQTSLARISPDPVIILGNQKSGTTAIAALLAASTGLPATLDIRAEMHRPALHLVRRGKMSFGRYVFMRKLDFAKQIIKEPSLTFFFNDLVRTFAQPRFVFIVRDPRENIRSMLNRFDIPGSISTFGSETYPSMHATWRMIFDGSQLGERNSDIITNMAVRWNLAADAYLEHPDQMILLRYEDFLRDKTGSIARLAGDIGLEPRCDIAQLVDVQYQPRGTHHAAPAEFFSSRNLQVIERLCESRMISFGYGRAS